MRLVELLEGRIFKVNVSAMWRRYRKYQKDKRMEEHAKRKDVYLLDAPRGLGISLIKGYEYAIKELKADIVIPNPGGS